MNQTANVEKPVVPPEEVERRIAEYRRLGFGHRAPAHIVYQGPHQACPWPGCDYRIAGIAFQLEQLGDPEQQARWLESWWQGPGLVGPCPGCGRLVLFGMADKQRITEVTATPAAVLPEDWHQK